MRYERVQDILDNDSLLRTKLSPRTVPVDTRFGEKLLVSKEVAEVTQAIHAEGKDAHKVPKHEVLKVALRVMKVIPANGEISAIGARPPLASAAPAPVASAAPADKIKPKPKTTLVVKTKPTASAPAPSTKPKKSQPVRAAAMASKPQTAKPQATKPESKGAKPVKVARSTKAASPKATLAAPAAKSRPAPPELNEDRVPESELPPERQPLHLPVSFDPRKYPHYNVQISIYTLLLSALNLSENFEKYPDYEERQRKLELVIKDYLETCDAIKNGA